jgi:hypothetical protein
MLPLPMPTVWEGPEEFQSPPLRIRPGAQLVWVETCATENGTTQTETRLTGLRRTLRGETDVRLDVNGRRIGELVMTDTGAIVDARTDPGFAEFVGGMVTFMSEIRATRTKTLRQARPVQMSVPTEPWIRALRAQLQTSGLEFRERTVPPMAVSIEYLGQTDRKDQRVAGYCWQARLTNAWGSVVTKGREPMTVEFEIVVDGLQFVDAHRGVDLMSEESKQVSFQFSGRERTSRRERCQTHFQPKSSREG